MTGRTELLAAVLADPACDAKRLIYADWLEDHGEFERAEFIRHSIRHGIDEDGYPNMRGILGIPVEVGFVVSRGFIESLSGPLAALLEHGPAIVREHPVERVEVTDFNGSIRIQFTPTEDMIISDKRAAEHYILAELRRRVDDSSTLEGEK